MATTEISAPQGISLANRMPAKRELERKFLVKRLPEGLSQTTPISILTVYVKVGKDGSEERVRKEGGKFVKTLKAPLKSQLGPGALRSEDEEEIDEAKFHRGLREANGRTIEKSRYVLYQNERKIELDIFSGKLKGLVTVEVEFANEDEYRAFRPLSWFGPEVTNDSRYKGRRLAVEGLPQDEKLQKLMRKPKQQITCGFDEGLQKAVALIDSKRFSSGSKCVVVAVAGPSASGKGFWVKRLEWPFCERVTSISLDMFYRPDETRTNFDEKGAINLKLAASLIRDLKAGEPILIPSYGFDNKNPKNWEPRYPREFVIVEGLHALSSPIIELADVKIFLETGIWDQIVRRILRDMKERPTFTPAGALKYFLGTALPMQRKYVDPTKKNADIIVSTSYNPHIEASKAEHFDNQIKYRLQGITEAKIIAAGALRIGEFRQTDEYINPPEPTSSKRERNSG